MDNTRINKIDRLVQKEISNILLSQTRTIKNIIITVSEVRVSSDLSIAKVYISVFPSNKGEEIVKNLNGNEKAIRFELGTKVRYQLRIIPELKFFLDESLDKLEHIDELLKK
ncbi:MAG: 30S ribosome-binding factor RbfA [Phocaeicola sp.]|uniref:30S ribosome-binding factor RbfA n=1 Tax=Phocaeicola TaxID=909656 RepID=UPI00234E6A8C|nr:30S ribosome-binding factor RbfA [Phocaeicola oris]MCE2617251.1 30S ribosome-binding factor RbfA [Phocaeicola oris]